MSERISEAELLATDGHTPGEWRWAEGWSIAEWGDEPYGEKYVDLQLYALSGEPFAEAAVVIPIRVDHYEPIFDAAGPDAITPADRALISLAPRLVAEVRRLRALIVKNGTDSYYLVEGANPGRVLRFLSGGPARRGPRDQGGAGTMSEPFDCCDGDPPVRVATPDRSGNLYFTCNTATLSGADSCAPEAPQTRMNASPAHSRAAVRTAFCGLKIRVSRVRLAPRPPSPQQLSGMVPRGTCASPATC